MTQPSFMQLDQVGLPAGTPGFARSDGLDTGAVVTVTDTRSGGGTTAVQLLYVPKTPYDVADDTTAVASLIVTPGNQREFTFAPTAGARGSYRILLVRILADGTRTEERRIFAVLGAGVRRPAPGERAAANVTLLNFEDADLIADCEFNEPSAAYPLGNPYGWLVDVLGGGGGGAGLSKIITPPALAADANDYNPTGLTAATVVRVSASGVDRTITGMASQAGAPTIRDQILMINVGTALNVILKHNDNGALSAVENEFEFSTGLDFPIGPNGDAIRLFYDVAAQFWRPA